ncbi:TonB-dependent receptor plug domain-containing protein [uncultured Tenacibaculum sp.]|uniref:TonB-dependent receptor plug domain-containing protein n=1 Tax=uncultured Tenacibaculum sp. TaxID=174713 RepID=UPI00261FCA31|nr:TonB-dependent receptor plug domain-containing protein [uncultured Tenacibaculum sp.]
MKLNKHLLLIFTLIIFTGNIFSQKTQEIYIIVKDQKNIPIQNATILFDNIEQPIKTDSKGIFKISTKIKPKNITAFSIKHGINTISYHGKKYNRIKLPNSKTIASSEEQKPFGNFQYRNIYDYIRAKQIPGVTISSNNQIIIRGVNSLNSSSEPLYVVNNAPVGLPTFENITPESIKKITVLKGSDAAYYGLRGANGVIKVTTY